MTDIPFTFEEFDTLCATISRDLRRIAYGTQGECTIDDMKSEAYIEAIKLLESGKHSSISSPEFQNHILARLYNRLCKFTSKVVRYAIRLDDTGDDEDSDKSHWLEGQTASQDDDPAAQLIQIEEMQEKAQEHEKRLNASYSQATVYIKLFENFWPNQTAIAEQLALSWKWVLHKVRQARKWVQWQSSLFDGIEVIDDNFVPIPNKLKHPKPLSRSERSTLEHQRRLVQQKLFPCAYVPIWVVKDESDKKSSPR